MRNRVYSMGVAKADCSRVDVVFAIGQRFLLPNLMDKAKDDWRLDG